MKLTRTSPKTLSEMMQNAHCVFLQHFPETTCFERAVFYSWACKLEDCCTYCYMSSLPKEKRTKEKRRSIESILAETIIIKMLGWDYGFFSGGVGVLSDKQIIEILSLTNKILNKKVWLNIGSLSEEQLKNFKPFIEGVVGTVEVINPELHKKICPSKPIEDVEKMFDSATSLNIKKAITLIIGLGEKKEDFALLKDFIEKNKLVKIHIYGLNPQKNTFFENSPGPTKEEQAWWIAQTRLCFPRIDIQLGIWENRTDRISFLLNAGANSISKYPALKRFATDSAYDIELQARKAGRTFRGTLTDKDLLKKIEWDRELNDLPLSDRMKKKIRIKIDEYVKGMLKNTNNKTKLKSKTNTR